MYTFPRWRPHINARETRPDTRTIRALEVYHVFTVFKVKFSPTHLRSNRLYLSTFDDLSDIP